MMKEEKVRKYLIYALAFLCIIGMIYTVYRERQEFSELCESLMAECSEHSTDEARINCRVMVKLEYSRCE